MEEWERFIARSVINGTARQIGLSNNSQADRVERLTVMCTSW